MVVQISREGWGVRRGLGIDKAFKSSFVSIREQIFNSWKVIGTIVVALTPAEERVESGMISGRIQTRPRW